MPTMIQPGMKNVIPNINKQGIANNTIQKQSNMARQSPGLPKMTVPPWPSLRQPMAKSTAASPALNTTPKWNSLNQQPISKPTVANTTQLQSYQKQPTVSASTMSSAVTTSNAATTSNTTPASTIPAAPEKKSKWQKFKDGVGNFLGKGAELLINGVTEVVSGGTEVASHLLGSAVGLFSSEKGESIKTGGKQLSDGISEFGNEVAVYGNDMIYGKISGTPRNDEEQMNKVLQSKYISSFNGQTVLRCAPNGRSASLGPVMLLGPGASEETLRHEAGHYEQYKELIESSGPFMGRFKYFAGIGLPSLLNDDYQGNYYEQAWEVTADMKGGVDTSKRTNPNEQTYAPGSEAAGERYLEYLHSVQSPKDYLDFVMNLGKIKNHDLSIVDEKLDNRSIPEKKPLIPFMKKPMPSILENLK